MTTQQVHSYEHGLTKLSLDRLVEIARALGCPVTDFVGGFDKIEARQSIGDQIAVQLGLAEVPRLLLAYYGGMPRALRRSTLKLFAIAADQADQRQDDSALATRGKLRLDKHVPS